MTDRYQKMLDRIDALAETERERILMRFAADVGASTLYSAVSFDGADITKASIKVTKSCNEHTRDVWADALAEMREAE